MEKKIKYLPLFGFLSLIIIPVFISSSIPNLVDGDSKLPTIDYDTYMKTRNGIGIGNFTFNGGWENNGFSIINGDIYAQTGYFYNLTSLNITKQNITVTDFLNVADTLYVDDVNKRVGIGTSNPSGKLQIDAAFDQIRLNGTSNSNNYDGAVINFQNDGGKRFDVQIGSSSSNTRVGANNFGIYDYGHSAARLVIDQNGNVGIGTAEPDEKLDVAGDVLIRGSDGWNGAGDDALLTFGSTDRQIGFRADYTNGDLLFGVFKTSGGGTFGTNSIDAMVIKGTSGKVGIGTTSPNTKLVVSDVGTTGFEVNPSNSSSRVDLVAFSREDTTYRQMRLLTSSFQVKTGTDGSIYAMTVDASGNVGIGTTSPSHLLNVYSSGNGEKLRVNSDASSFVIAPGASAVSLLGWDGTSTRSPLDIRATSATQLYLNTDGNVGIGTTSPLNRLQIGESTVQATYGSVSIKQNTANDGFTTQASSNDDYAMLRHNGSATIIQSDYQATGAYTPIAFYTSGAEKVRIDTNGNVGIGTSSPEGLLHVKGTNPYILINDSVNNQWGFTIGASGVNNKFQIRDEAQKATRLLIDDSGNVGIGTTSPNTRLEIKGSTDTGAAISINRTNVNRWSMYVDDNGKLRFYDASDTTQMVIENSSGNVGIGTTSPGIKLEVVGQIGVSTGSNVNLKMNPADDTLTGVNHASIKTNNDLLQIFTLGANPLLFGINGVEKVRIDNTGNVGIGTTSPKNKLNVKGLTNSTLGFAVNGSVGYSGFCVNTTYSGGIAVSCND